MYSPISRLSAESSRAYDADPLKNARVHLIDAPKMPRKISVHQSVERPPARVRDTNKDYDYVWRKLRKRFLTENPYCACELCKSGEIKLTLADVVDHIIPVRERPDLRLEWSNLRSMYKRHHDRHTRLQQMRKNQ